MNTQILIKVADAIEASLKATSPPPVVFDMTNWAEPVFQPDDDHIEKVLTGEVPATCGTTACLAGWIVYIESPERYEGFIRNSWYEGHGPLAHSISSLATDILRAPPNVAARLFIPNQIGDPLDGVGINDVNDNRKLVPAALRWMVMTETYDWNAAAIAVGFKLEEREEDDGQLEQEEAER